MATQGRKVQSIEKASTLLDCFWTAQRPLALSELVQMTGWAKSTIHGILSTMVDCAMVEQNPFDGKYRLGYHLFELGSAVHFSWDAVTVSKPYLLHLVATLNESAYLARLTGNELLLADCAEPHVGFRVSSESGTRMPLHCTSQGKAILAFHPESEVKMLLRHKEMTALTPNTITEWEPFRQQLARVRETGVAMEREEYKRVEKKIHTYIPESSIVGVLLEHAEDYAVIDSNNRAVMQHEPLSWGVLGAKFVHLGQRSQLGQLSDGVLQEWIGSLSAHEREEFSEALFEILSVSGKMRTLDDLRNGGLVGGAALLKGYIGADEKKKHIIMETFRRLAVDIKEEVVHSAGEGIKSATHVFADLRK